MRRSISQTVWVAFAWASFGEGVRAFRVEPWTYTPAPHVSFHPFPIDMRFSHEAGFDPWALLLAFAILAMGAVLATVLRRWSVD